MAKCPACAFDNPDSQKFCGECGARLGTAVAPPTHGAPERIAPSSASYTPPHLAERILTSRSALEGERKLVTVMFCDIANSTPLAAGPLDEAASHLSAVVDLTNRISSFRMQAGAGGTLAKCRLRQGRLDDAEAVLRKSFDLIEAKNLRGEWLSEPMNAFVELHLLKAQQLSGSSREDALRTARRSCAKALRCTRDAPTWRCETERLRGTLAWLSDDRRSAEDWWRKSLATAERVGMPIERARTLLEKAQWSGDVALVDQAARVFEATRARVDLALSLHARARLAVQRGEDVGSLVEHYDQAIAALDAMNVEHELATAKQQRAALRAKIRHPA